MDESHGSGDADTPRSPSEQALKEAVERTELALAAANMGIWSLDAVTQIIMFDERAQAMWGLPQGVTACAVSQLEHMVHRDDRAARRAERQKGLDPDGDGRFEVEYRIAARGEHPERWVAVRGQTTFSGGHAARMIGTMRDITARKTVEQRLRASEEKLSFMKSELEARGRCTHAAARGHARGGRQCDPDHRSIGNRPVHQYGDDPAARLCQGRVAWSECAHDYARALCAGTRRLSEVILGDWHQEDHRYRPRGHGAAQGWRDLSHPSRCQRVRSQR